jgi:serine/threonine protein kinase
MKKCVYKGKQTTLLDKEFLASGGEGDVFLHAGLIFKIYHNPLRNDFVKKIGELFVLDHPNIIRPLDIVYGLANEPIGYTMNYADNTANLPLLFTTSYITRNNITLQATQTLVGEIMKTAEFIHSKKCLIVDANEFNTLVDKATYAKPFLIDVDSFETPSFPATAIMPSIRDYTASKFTELTDFYSLGVITFQLFTGIHPYKGKHPSLKTIEERCKNHISVLNKDVSTPPSVRDFAAIPPNYFSWYEDLFEKGLRTPPPDMTSAVQMRAKRKYVSAAFNIEKVFQAGEPIKAVDWLYGNCIVMTENYVYVNTKQFDRHDKHSVVVASIDGVLYEAYFTANGLILVDIFRKISQGDPSHMANKWFAAGGRLELIYESQLMEIEIRKMGDKVIALTSHVQPIAEQSSQVFTNVVYANIFGKAFFYIPCAPKAVAVWPCPLLNHKRVLDAINDKEQTIVIAADPDGTIKRYRLSVAGDGGRFEEVEEIAMQETNTIMLSNGISITYDSVEDQIDLAPVSQNNHKVVKGAGLPQGASLVVTGTTAHYFVDDSLYKFSMR